MRILSIFTGTTDLSWFQERGREVAAQAVVAAAAPRLATLPPSRVHAQSRSRA